MSLIRNMSDWDIAIGRLSQHPYLTKKPSHCSAFSIFCQDKNITRLLSIITQLAPFKDQIGRTITVWAYAQHHPLYPRWLGLQTNHEIRLYFPAYCNVTTVIFTFFHEYAHWLKKQPSVDTGFCWDSSVCAKPFPWQYRSAFDNACENFANAFAWYITNRNYLKVAHPRSFEMLENCFQERIKHDEIHPHSNADSFVSHALSM